MAKASINIQDGFLFQSLKAAKPITIQLLTGNQLEGQLKRFDRFALVLEIQGREVLVYKHGIVTVESASEES
jgi:host factor-I protein